jgi:hypothetical protein
MTEQTIIGYYINDEGLVCMSCGYANKDAQLIKPAHIAEYPEGLTCIECGDVVAP